MKTVRCVGMALLWAWSLAASARAGVTYFDLTGAPVTGTNIVFGNLLGAGSITATLPAPTNSVILQYRFAFSPDHFLSWFGWNVTNAPQVLFSTGTVLRLPAQGVVGTNFVTFSTATISPTEWPEGQSGYLAFRFRTNNVAEWRYGWMEAIRSNTSWTVFGAAFSDVEGQVLRAGQTNDANTVITGLQNGLLTWSDPFTNSLFAVEWAPTVTGAWSRSWSALTNVPYGGTITTSAVPMFYRIIRLN